jgi:hypothetical protein
MESTNFHSWSSIFLIVNVVWLTIGCSTPMSLAEKRALPPTYSVTSEKNIEELAFCMTEGLQSYPKAGIGELAATGYSIGSFTYEIVSNRKSGETRISGKLLGDGPYTDILIYSQNNKIQTEFRSWGQRKYSEATIKVINRCTN